jgi:protein TonB
MPPLRVRQGAAVTEAALENRVSPVYPKEARKKGISGSVRLHAIIGQDGTVQDLTVVSGDPLLVEAALAAVRQWRYRPMLLEGKPTEVDTVIDVVFSLGH